MASDNVIRIQITETGSKQVSTNIKEVGTSAQSSASSIYILQAALGGFASSEILKSSIDLIDSYQTMYNRLIYLSGGTEQAAYAMQILYDISIKTRTSLEDTVDTYAKITLAVEGMGIAHATTARLVQTLNEALILSGSSVKDGAQAIQQLIRGLSQGELTGRPLLALLRQMPAVADLIAEHFGVTRQALQELGTQGKITADVVIQSLLEAGQKIDSEFGKLPLTISQSFTIASNKVTFFFGQLSQQIPIIQLLDSTLQTLADHAGGIFAVAIGVTLAGAFVTLAVAVNFLTLAIAANPLTAFLAILTAVTGALITFIGELKISSDSSATFFDLATAVARNLKQIFTDLISSLDAFNQTSGNTDSFVLGLARDMAEFADIGVAGLLKVISLFGELTIEGTLAFVKLGGVIENFGYQLEKFFIGIINKITDAINVATTSTASLYNNLASLPGLNTVFTQITNVHLIPQISTAEIDQLQARLNTAQAITEAFLRGLDSLVHQFSSAAGGQSFFSDLLEKSIIDAKAVAKLRQDALTGNGPGSPQDQFNTAPEKSPLATSADVATDKIVQKLKAEQVEYTLTTQEARTYALVRKSIQEAETLDKGQPLGLLNTARIAIAAEESAQLQHRFELTKQITRANSDYADKVQILNDLIAKGGPIAVSYANDLAKLNLEYDKLTGANGVKLAIDEIKVDLQDMNQQLATTIVDTFHKMQDALNQFIVTGKINFKSLVDSMLQDALKLTENTLISNLLSSYGSGGKPANSGGVESGGSSASGIVGLIGSVVGIAASAFKADGGPVQAGNSYIVGEHQPELFTPNVSGTISPSVNNYATASQAQVHVHIHNYTDPDEIPKAIARGDADAQIVNAVRRNRSSVNKVLS